MGITLPAINRRSVSIAVIGLILVSYGLYLPLLPSDGLRGVKKAGKGGVTYIYEMDTHDGQSWLLIRSYLLRRSGLIWQR